MTDPETPDKKGKLTLPVPHIYDVGYGKPPLETRFKPGQSGNPRGRPRGAKNKTSPNMAEERLKTLVMEEAYRVITIVDKGKRIDIPIIQAVVRSLAMNAVKGNNRAAQLFSSMVSTTEAANREQAAETFATFFEYRQKWQIELARRKDLGLNLPDPVPHPDDIILDAKTMSVRIVGPLVADDIPRYQLGAQIYDVYEDLRAETEERLASTSDEQKKLKLQRDLRKFSEAANQLRIYYGPRSERIKDPIIREVEDWLGVPLEMQDERDV